MKGKILYRVAVQYPEGAQQPDGYLDPEWEPKGWEGFPADHPLHDSDYFIWPAEKVYWSRSAAARRAELFRRYGAKAEVQKSNPITFGAPQTFGLPEQPPVGSVVGRRDGDRVIYYRRIVDGRADGWAFDISKPPAVDGLPLLEWWQVLKLGAVQLISDTAGDEA